MRSLQTLFWTIVSLVLAVSLFAQNPKLLKDINPRRRRDTAFLDGV